MSACPAELTLLGESSSGTRNRDVIACQSASDKRGTSTALVHFQEDREGMTMEDGRLQQQAATAPEHRLAGNLAIVAEDARLDRIAARAATSARSAPPC